MEAAAEPDGPVEASLVEQIPEPVPSPAPGAECR